LSVSAGAVMKRTGRRRKNFTDTEVDLYCQDMEDFLTKIKVQSESRKKKKKKKKPKDILTNDKEDENLLY
jgi:predicted AAA+ superfamily ATPase